MPDIIIAEKVGKRFRRGAPRPGTLQEAILHGLRPKHRVEEFWALRDVSFRVGAGRVVGLIGANGGGKSTLLRLIGGVGRPDEGRVEARGRIGAMLDLGAGFHGDLTGRENVHVAGVIAGLTKRQTVERIESIVEFAELRDFIDSPYRIYSSGMQMRLAFSVAVHVDPEMLLIDEVFSVGDHTFQQKCVEKIAEFRGRGCTIMVASHDTALIRGFCDEAIWLRAGELIEHGPAAETVSSYLAASEEETRRRSPRTWPVAVSTSGMELRLHENRSGSLELEMTAVRLLDRGGQSVAELDGGDPLRIEIEYAAHRPIPAPIFVVAIIRDDGVICCETHTEAAGLNLPTLTGRGSVALKIERLDLNRGNYWVEVKVYERGWTYAYDSHVDAYTFSVRSGNADGGILHPPHSWDVRGVPEPEAPTLLSKVMP